MAYWDMFTPRKTVGERKADAARAIAKHKGAGRALSPVEGFRGNRIGKTFWGRSWCDNLERYRDFAYRLERGRSYLRSGSVIDLQISAGQISAQVMGSRLYKVEVEITRVADAHWQTLSVACASAIDSLVSLLQGRLDASVMTRLSDPRSGLFPTPAEIDFRCSCPDIAQMCKHVAAVLYGVGVRLDDQPELLFTLRRVEAADLVGQVSARPSLAKTSTRTLEVGDDLEALFGVELADDTHKKKAAPATKKKAAPPAKKRAAPPAKKKAAPPARKKAAPPTRKKAAPPTKKKAASPGKKKATPAAKKKAAPPARK